MLSELNSIKQFAEKYWKQLGAKSPFFRAWFGDWRVNDSTPIIVANRQGDSRGLVKNNDTDREINISRKVFTETESHTSPENNIEKTYLPYIRDIIRNAVLLDSYGINPTKSENSILMHSFYAVADIGNGSEVLKLYVEEMYNPTAKDTSHRAYQLQGIEKQQFAVTGSGKTLAVSKQTVAVKTVSDLFGLVKQKDKNFNPKPTSKVVNAYGTPKIMYHATQEQFTVFDKKKAKSSVFYGKGFYLIKATATPDSTVMQLQYILMLKILLSRAKTA